MAIKVRDLHKEDGIWYYEQDWATTQKQLINDNFFNITGWREYTYNDTTVKTQIFNWCDATEFEAIQLGFESLGCLQSLSISINEQYKTAQNNYRYYKEKYGWICTDLYRDIIKMTISIKAQSTECEIIEVDGTAMALAALLLVDQVLRGECNELLEEIRGGSIYCVAQPNLSVAIINNPFNDLGVNYDVQVIPKNMQKPLDANTAYDVNMECTVDGKTVIGRVVVQCKTITPLGGVYDDTDSSGGGSTGTSGGTVRYKYSTSVDYSMGSIEAGGIIKNTGIYDTAASLMEQAPRKIIPHTDSSARGCAKIGLDDTYNFLKLYGDSNSYLLGADFAYAGYQGGQDSWGLRMQFRTPEGSTGYLLGEIDNWGDELHLYIDPSGQLVWKMKTSSPYIDPYGQTTQPTNFTVASGVVVNDGLWHMVVISSCPHAETTAQWGDPLMISWSKFIIDDTAYGSVPIMLWHGPPNKIYPSTFETQLAYYDTTAKLGIGCLWNKGVISNNLECDIALLHYYGVGLDEFNGGVPSSDQRSQKNLFGYGS